MPDVSALQRGLVEELKRRKCIRTAAVEAAFRAIPRHLFVPGVPLDDVYRDIAIPTKRSTEGGFISSSSQPAIMALMLEQLALAPGHRVLEVGAGTGYNAALIAHIVGSSGLVVTMDIDEDTVGAAREHLASAGIDGHAVRVICGDGGLGYPDAAPFDRIILTVGAEDISPAWWEQLRAGGRLLLPLSIKGPQLCVAFDRMNDHLESVSIEECGFMMLRGAFAGPGGSVQIGEVSMATAAPHVVHADALGAWLKGPGEDRPTGIRVSAGNVFASLNQWLAFRASGWCWMSAVGDAAKREVIPDLFRWSFTTVRQIHTIGVISDRGLCVFARPRAAPAGGTEPEWKAPFELLVRSYGADEALADRVVEHVRAWDAAGRPSKKGLRIKAFPIEAGYRPSDGEIVVDKRWSRLVLDWH